MALITTENARQLSAKGKEVIRANRERRRNLEQQVQALAVKIAELSASHDKVNAERLIRVRKQLAMVDSRIEEEACKKFNPEDPVRQPGCDGQLLNWLCSAQERLAEQERQLSGRPLPGTLRPEKPKSKPTQLPPAPDTQ